MPSPHPARFAPLQAAALAILTLLTSVALAPAAVPEGPAVLDRAAADEASLAAARDRSARAAASVESLKWALAPGHLTDPMLDADRPFGLEALRSAYADVQRKAAGYRATLGEHHPTLVAAEQVLADLRTQLLDGTRKALAAAERDAREARATAETLERRLATRAAAASARLDRIDVTGSIKPPVPPPSPTALPAGAAAGAAVETRDTPAPPRRTPVPSHTLAGALLGLAAMVLAMLIAVWVALRLLAARRPAGPSGRRRVEPALSRPVPSSETTLATEAGPAPSPRRPLPVDTVPVLATLPASVEPGADPAAANGLHATLRAAFVGGPDVRMTVLVAPAAGLSEPEADGVALALAFAAAAAGGRPLILEARAAGRLRRERAAFVAPLLIEAGGAVRTLYRLDTEGLTVAVLPSDPGEAEAAANAATRPDTARLHGLSAFDTVILLGDDPEALATGADLILIAAPAGVEPADLIAAARPLCGAGRPCGALLVARVDSVSAAARPAPRRRIVPDAGQPAAARLGLRGTLDPGRRRLGG